MMNIFISLVLFASGGVSPQLVDPCRFEVVSGVSVKLCEKIQWGKRTFPLKGWGVREKSFGLFSVNVYVAAYHANPSGDFPKSLQLAFVRDVPQEKIRASYEEALKLNGVAITKTFAKVLDSVSINMTKGDGVWIQAENGNHLKVIDKNGEVTYQDANVATDFLKIWFGKSADSGLEVLKHHLLGEKTT